MVGNYIIEEKKHLSDLRRYYMYMIEPLNSLYFLLLKIWMKTLKGNCKKKITSDNRYLVPDIGVNNRDFCNMLLKIKVFIKFALFCFFQQFTIIMIPFSTRHSSLTQ